MTDLASPSRPFAVTNRSVLAIAIPMTLAYLSTPLLGLVDTAVIGQLGDAALLGGLAVGSILIDVVFSSLNFLRSGTTGLTAQAYGRDATREIQAILLRALILALACGLAIILLQWPLRVMGLSLIGGSSHVQEAADTYLRIRIYSAPIMLANYVVLGWFLGLGMAKTGLAIQTFLNSVNIALSVLFVLTLDWGIAGVASATILSEVATLALGFWLVFRRNAQAPWPSSAEIFNKHQFAALVALNRDIMIRSFTLLFAFAFFTSRSAGQGDVILAANTILQKFLTIAGYFLDGIATAAEQLAGRALGARYRPAFDKAVRLTLIWGFALAGGASLIFWFGGDYLIAVMTTSENVRFVASDYLIWAALTPICGTLAYQMDGVFIGATWSRDMRNMMLLSLLGYLGVFYAAFPFLGNHGLWLAILSFLSLRGITLSWMCVARRRQAFS